MCTGTCFAAGAILTVQISALTSDFGSATDDVTNILGELEQDGYDSNGAPVISTPGLASEVGTSNILGQTPYQATLYLEALTAGDTVDTEQEIEEAINDVSGAPATSVAVTNIQSGGVSSAVGNTATASGGASSNSSSAFGQAWDWITNAINNAKTELGEAFWAIVIGLIGLIVLVLVLAAYHPDSVRAVGEAGALAAT
jgi:hypothetical protein